MPLDFDYPPAYLGRIWSFSFDSTPIRIRLASTGSSGSFRRRDFEIRVTAACRILQGGSDVTASSSTGRYTPSSLIRRVTVTSKDDAYISVVGTGNTSGSIEIGVITEDPAKAEKDEPTQVG